VNFLTAEISAVKLEANMYRARCVKEAGK
jgi:hypothetical protein